MVSRALVVGAYQRKLEELAKEPDIELTAIIPPAWREGRRTVRLDRAHTQGYQLIIAPLAFNGQFHLHFYPNLGRLLRELRPDVLHMDEEPYNLATWHALSVGKRLGARCLFFTWQNLQRRYPWPFRSLEAANYRLADYAIAGNQAAAGVLRSKGYHGRLAVIPQFGVDPDIFSPAAGGTNRQEAGFTIGYAGRLVTEKGIDTLLRACAALPFRAGRCTCWAREPIARALRRWRHNWASATAHGFSAACHPRASQTSIAQWTCWCCHRSAGPTGSSSSAVC